MAPTGVMLGRFEADAAMVFLENAQGVAGFALGDFLGNGGNARGVEAAIAEAGAEELLREFA